MNQMNAVTKKKDPDRFSNLHLFTLTSWRYKPRNGGILNIECPRDVSPERFQFFFTVRSAVLSLMR